MAFIRFHLVQFLLADLNRVLSFLLLFLRLLDLGNQLVLRLNVLVSDFAHLGLQILSVLNSLFFLRLKPVVGLVKLFHFFFIAFADFLGHASALADRGLGILLLVSEHLVPSFEKHFIFFIFLESLIRFIVFEHLLDGSHNLWVCQILLDVESSQDQQLPEFNCLLLFLALTLGLVEKRGRIDLLGDLVLKVFVHLRHCILFELLDSLPAGRELQLQRFQSSVERIAILAFGKQEAEVFALEMGLDC